MARQRQLRLTAAGLVAGFALLQAPRAAVAQIGRNVVNPSAPFLMIPPLRSTEKNLGVQAADALRSRLLQDIPFKALYVIPKGDITSTLEASGFPPTEALAPNDARELGKVLRADEYIDGTVTKGPNGFRIESKLVLTRDNSLVQPLPVAEGPRLDLASAQFSRGLQDARKQIEFEKKCASAAREQKYADAIIAARAGIAAYPKATLARICLANVYSAQKASPDSIIAIGKEILQIDPRSRQALLLLGQAYKDQALAVGKTDTVARNVLLDQMLEAWSTLIASDPKNTRIVNTVVNEIALSGNARIAVPIIEAAMTENPGDVDLLRLRFLVDVAAREWKKSIVAGEDLATADTASLDSLFYNRLVRAYTEDSAFAKAAEWAMKGAQKFPTLSSMWVLASRAQRLAGQLPMALEAARKAVALKDPKQVGLYVVVAQMQYDMGQKDSAFATLHQAVAAKDSLDLVGQFSTYMASKALSAAQIAKADSDWARVLLYASFADSLAPTANTKFMIGYSAFSLGVSALQVGQEMMKDKTIPKAKMCEQWTKTQDYTVVAQINVAKGGSAQPGPAGQIMAAMTQFGPFLEQQLKLSCGG